MSGGGEGNGRVEEEVSSPTRQEQEVMLKKKYGGLIPKKPPLIAKDHERAFFDSADWALGKQGTTPNPLISGSKPKSAMEALRPKLQPTPHQPLPARRSSYAAPDGEDLEALMIIRVYNLETVRGTAEMGGALGEKENQAPQLIANFHEIRLDSDQWSCISSKIQCCSR